MELIDKIKIDMARKGNTPVVYAMQGDYNSRLISATLFNNGFPIDVNGNAVSVAYKKPDGTSGWYDTLPDGNSAICIEASEVLAKIAPEMLTVPGMVYAAIRIESESGESRATTFPFVVNVSEDPGYNSAKSENYYNVQNWDDVNSKFAEIEELLKTVGNGIDDTVISKESTWSSKNIVDKLCPSFTESGGVVCCEPLDGYPLEVVSTINDKGDYWESITLRQSGKNLLKYPYYETTMTRNGITFTDNGDGTITANGTATADANFICAYWNECDLPPGRYHFKSYDAKHAGAVLANIAFRRDGVSIFDTLDTVGGVDIELTDRPNTFYCIVRVKAGKTVNNFVFKPQLEASSVATDYEPYWEQPITADFANLDEAHVLFGSYNWQTGVLNTGDDGYYQHDPATDTFTYIENIDTYVPPTVRNIYAVSGTNSFYSDCGDTQASGKSDPVAIIEKQETIIAEQEAELAKLNKQYELIEEVTLEEDVESFTRTADTNGNPYNFSAMRIYVDATAAEGANNNSQMIFSLGTKSNNFAIYLQATGGITNTARNTLLNAQNENGFRSVWFATATSGGTSTNIQTISAHYTYIWENVTRLALSTHPSTLKIPAGTCIRIYGIRG